MQKPFPFNLFKSNYILLNMTLVFALLMSLAPNVVWASNDLQKIQPILQTMAAQHPDELVGIIVQKMVEDNEVEEMVVQLGGRVTKDLHIIRAFAAKLPAASVFELAKSDAVRWISLDAPVIRTGELLTEDDRKSELAPHDHTIMLPVIANGEGEVNSSQSRLENEDDEASPQTFLFPAIFGSGTTVRASQSKTQNRLDVVSNQVEEQANYELMLPIVVAEDDLYSVHAEPALQVSAVGDTIVRDEFNNSSFSNNDGNANWNGGWVENDPESGGAGPTTGQVRIMSGELRLDDYPNTGGYPNIARQTDLSAATTATLSFAFRTTSGVDTSDAVAVEVSSNGGASYTVLETFTGISGTTAALRSYDISSFTSANTTIRFRVTNYYGGSNEYFYVDNIQVASSGDSGGTASGDTTVRDEFNSALFSNNDGNANWSGDWIENDPQSGGVGPDAGQVRISGGELRLDDYPNTGGKPSAARQVDLSSATSAVLSFNYRTTSGVDTSDGVQIQISSNGGASYTLMEQFSGFSGITSGSRSYDISNFIATNTTVRIQVTSYYGGSNEYFYVDNIQIQHNGDSNAGGGNNGGGNNGGGNNCDSDNCSEQIIRDEFTKNAFNGDNGTIPWLTDWVEHDPGYTEQSPNDGKIRIINNELRMDNQAAVNEEPSIARGIELSGNVVSAILSFDFRTTYGVDASDGFAIDISYDGGSNYILLDTVEGLSGTNSGSKSYDITPFATAKMIIRFRIPYNYAHSNEYVYIDNVQIAYITSENPPSDGDRQTISDDFGAVPYIFDNNSGSRDWLTEWQEVGESDGPTSGDIYITNFEGSTRLRIWTDRLQGQAWEPVRGVWRTVDLSGSTVAELRFLYSRSTMEVGDSIAVQASSNGGGTWTEVGRIDGKGISGISGNDSGWRYASYDISNFISANTAIRLISSFNNDDFYDSILIDDLTVSFDGASGTMPSSYYIDTLNVRPVWNMGGNGIGITVAVVDSGIALDDDFSLLPNLPGTERILEQLGFNEDTEVTQDAYGHGTHVAGIIGGNGNGSNGFYTGIAPMVNLLGLKVSDDQGLAYESDTVAALQWIYDNKDIYNIRIVNLSINSTVEQSYHTSPLDAAAEILWFNGVVVVASAGNSGNINTYNTIDAAPANDPFIITVGASHEQATANRFDDTIASFSSSGTTMDGFVKPEIIAPGKDIISVLAQSSWWRNDHADRLIEGGYFRISGTSMAAPMVVGAAALLLQNEPTLTPDQVKYRLINTGSSIQDSDGTSYAYLDVQAAVNGNSVASSNTGITASQLLWTGSEPINWNSVNWNSVNWNSVNWNSVNWNSVNWNSVNWNSVSWDD